MGVQPLDIGVLNASVTAWWNSALVNQVYENSFYVELSLMNFQRADLAVKDLL